VLPLVNKGLALYQWKQDVGAAEACCHEALQLDPECEAAVATLAQLSLQQGKIEVAVEMFARQAELARSEPELANALTYQYVRAFSTSVFCVSAVLMRMAAGVVGAAGVYEELPGDGGGAEDYGAEHGMRRRARHFRAAVSI
jgi:tetratricopeptide (TPR) repeat protein